jgi:hypothetical protein
MCRNAATPHASYNCVTGLDKYAIAGPAGATAILLIPMCAFPGARLRMQSV